MTLPHTGWTPLLQAEPYDVAWRGTVFRCKAKWPYEAMVDFLLVHTHDAESEFAMVVATGAKAGILFQVLPPECRASGDRIAVSMGWLQQYWTRWIYPDCAPDDVVYAQCYPEPVLNEPTGPA